MAEKARKHTITADLNFNHLDPHFARFNVSQHPVKEGESELYGMRPINITPEMFPANFELSRFDVTGKITFEFEITPKK